MNSDGKQMLKRSTQLTESQYHAAIAVSKKYGWSLSNLISRCVRIVLKQEKENEVLRNEIKKN